VANLERFLQLLELIMRLRGFRPHRLEAAGHEIAYQEAGRRRKDGRSVVLVHGLGNSSSVWFKVVRRVVRRHHVLAIDLPGYGKSPTPPGQAFAQIGQLRDALIAFLEAKADGPYVLVGQSLGGWVSAKVAAKRPELVEQLVLVNNAGVYYPQVQELSELMLVETREEVEAFWRRLWHRMPVLNWLFIDDYISRMEAPRVVEFIESIKADDFINDDLPDLPVPTTILWGASDRFIPRQSVETMLRRLREAVVYWIPECGHIPQLERPKIVSRILEALLTSPPAPPPS
jgi:pimeloyl-ACP methyl ester carboxylesterase